jgi:hypothetical protein
MRTYNKIPGIIFLLILFATCLLPGQQGRLKGRITDSNSVPLPFVNIIIPETSFGTSSKEDGTYEIRSIPAGKYKVRFSAVGYETKTIDINIESSKTVELNVTLIERAIEVGTVEVFGNQFQNQSDTRTSVIDLNPRDAKTIPGATEDVFRTLQSLPGVLAPNEFSSQLIIRGSGPDQNLIIMDDIEVFNPYRLYGVISMFNPDAVSDINLVTGGFPAKYGDRLSAVLDVTNKEGTTKNYFSGSVNASIVDANIVLEGKNPFNLKGSWIFNSRRTYYDLIIEPFVKSAGLVEENTSFPNFYDLQAKIAVGPYDGHKFLFNGIYSRDGVNIISGKDRKTPDSINVFNITRNDVLGFGWHYAPNEKLFNKVIISWYDNSGTADLESEVLDPSLKRDAFEGALPDTLEPYLLGFNVDAVFGFTKYSVDDKFTYLWGKNIFEAGAGVDFMKTVIDFQFELDPELEAIIAAQPRFRAALEDINDRKFFNRYRSYIQNKFSFGNRFFFQPGLRFDYYDLLNKEYLAPRVSLSYAIDDLTTLRAVWGMYYQSPGYEKQRDQNRLYDLNEEFTQNLNAEKAIHYVIGIERWLTNEWRVRVEGYYKDFRDLIIQQRTTGSLYSTEPVPGRDPRYRAGWTNPVIIPGDSLTQIPVNAAVGEAYGLEFFLEKKNIFQESRFSGWISYSLAFADRIEYNLKLPFRFDQRHTVNIVLHYKLNSWLDIGTRWHYGSGFPISEAIGIRPRIILADNDLDGKPETPVVATRNKPGVPADQQEVIYDIDFGENRLNSRKPPYHRLDIRLTAYADYWGLDWAFYLDVINVYNRKNVIGYEHYVTEDLTLGREPTNMFPIIPTLGFSVKF